MLLADSFAKDLPAASLMAAPRAMFSADSFAVDLPAASLMAAPGHCLHTCHLLSLCLLSLHHGRCLLTCLLFLVPFILLIKIQPPCFVNKQWLSLHHCHRRCLRSLLLLKSAYRCIQPLLRFGCLRHLLFLKSVYHGILPLLRFVHTGRNWHYFIEIVNVGMMKIQSRDCRQC